MSRYKRPMPDDFREVAPGQSSRALCKIYTADHRTVMRWMNEAMISARPRDFGRIPVPYDLADRAKEMHLTALAKHYRLNHETVARMLERCRIKCLPRPKPVNTKPIPGSFADDAKANHLAELCRMYGENETVIYRWLRDLGIQARRVKSTSPNMSPTRSRVDYGLSITRTVGIHDQAARTQAWDRPVYRCTEKGKADFKGTFWRVGNVVCTPAELLERAARAERRAA